MDVTKVETVVDTTEQDIRGLSTQELLEAMVAGLVTADQAREEIERRTAEQSVSGQGRSVKEIISTKPGWITVRLTGRGRPITSTANAFLALFDSKASQEQQVFCLEAFEHLKALLMVAKAVKAVGMDEAKHHALACYSPAKVQQGAKRPDQGDDDGEDDDEQDQHAKSEPPKDNGNPGKSVGATLTGKGPLSGKVRK